MRERLLQAGGAGDGTRVGQVRKGGLYLSPLCTKVQFMTGCTALFTGQTERWHPKAAVNTARQQCKPQRPQSRTREALLGQALAVAERVHDAANHPRQRQRRGRERVREALRGGGCANEMLCIKAESSLGGSGDS